MRGFQPAAHRAAKTSGYAGGGVVRGPGTGTSDDVQDAVAPGTYIMPADSTQQVGAQNLETMGARGFQPGRKVAVNLSNGEFKLPPEQVHAIGVQALDQMKDATHAPVRGFSPGARPPAPPEPRFFFANGGLVSDPPQSAAATAAQPAAPAPAAAAAAPGAPMGWAERNAQRSLEVTASSIMPSADRDAAQSKLASMSQPANTAPPGTAPTPLGSTTPVSAAPAAVGFPAPALQRPPGLPPATTYATRPSFADGGVVKDEERRKQISPSNIYPQGSPSAGRSPYVGAAPEAEPQTRGFSPRPSGQSDQRAAGPSELYMQDRAQELKDQVSSGNYAQAAGTAARTAVQGLGMYGLELADKVSEPIIGAARGFGSGLFGTVDAAPAPAAAPAAADAPAAAPTASPAARGFAPGMAEESRRSVMQQAGAQPATAQAATGSAAEVRPGVFEHGRGQFSDQATGMNFPRGFSGRPTAAADAAAESLVRGFAPGMRPQAEASPVRGFQPGAFSAPVARHSGNDWQARNDLRNAQVSASSIMNNGGRWDQHKGMSPEAATAAAMTNADLAARAAQPGMDTEAMRQNAAVAREEMQQAGETQRAGARAAVEAQRTGIAAQQAAAQRRSVDSQVEAQGYANRIAAQQEQLRGVLVDPTASEAAKAQAQRALRALAGQGQNDWRVQVTPAVKNADGSTSEGSVLRYNQATGDVQRVDVAQGAAHPPSEALADPKTRPVGTVSTVNGKSAVWDGRKWVPKT
ncbi:hypothetical protein RCH27_08630 [Paracidovorax citrulli]|uniref:hypothetical protein n=1 Tax=Paracidovorax citrulli TaxID=80869 RepID=UPI003A808E3B